MSILGNRVIRVEDLKLLTAGGTYVDDLRDERLARAGYVTFVRSPVAHARIRSVDIGAAAGAPGVIAVVTAHDLGGWTTAWGLPSSLGGSMFSRPVTRWPLATDTVRFVGEPVAVVVTEQRYQGEDVAELVVVDYEPLPSVIDPEAAASDEVVLHDEAGSNTIMRLGDPLDDAIFDGCEVVVEQRTLNQRVAIAPLEGRACAAAWDGVRLTVWLSTQAPQSARDLFEQTLGFGPGSVHMITPDVGGGFGAKMGVSPEEVVVAWLARHLARPVRWTETRTENMVAMGHGRGQVQHVKIGGRRDGTVEAYQLDILSDAGAYASVGGILPMLTRMMAPAVYAIPRVRTASTTVVTNTAPMTAYRGAGRPEASAAIERAMDLFAREIGADPAEVRRRNLVPRDAFPYTTSSGVVYDSGDYERALDLALDAAGYAELRVEQARRRAGGDSVQLGVGVSVYVEITGGASAGSEVAKVEITPEGGARVYTGSFPHGQGHVTSWSMLASEQLGIPMEHIEVIHGDTDLVPVGFGTGGSRSLQLAGSAVHDASAELVELAKRKVAELLEASSADIALDKVDGRFHVAGTPTAGRSWAELASSEELVVETRFQAPTPTFPFGAHVAVVEVDTETGLVTVTRVVTVDDAGTLLNPLIVEGQRHGGIAQGVAQALLEEMVYDADGNPVTSNFADYALISACELPAFELLPMETPTPANPLGAKGIGESGACGATPAVQSAVIDALAHLGISHIDMPMTPQRVWSAIHEAGAGPPS